MKNEDLFICAVKFRCEIQKHCSHASLFVLQPRSCNQVHKIHREILLLGVARGMFCTTADVYSTARGEHVNFIGGNAYNTQGCRNKGQGI